MCVGGREGKVTDMDTEGESPIHGNWDRSDGLRELLGVVSAKEEGDGVLLLPRSRLFLGSKGASEELHEEVGACPDVWELLAGRDRGPGDAVGRRGGAGRSAFCDFMFTRSMFDCYGTSTIAK